VSSVFAWGMFAGAALCLVSLCAIVIINRIRYEMRVKELSKPCMCGGEHTVGEGMLSPLFCKRSKASE
jgi:hypothetical protein